MVKPVVAALLLAVAAKGSCELEFVWIGSPWCHWCKRFEHRVLGDAKIKSLMKGIKIRHYNSGDSALKPYGLKINYLPTSMFLCDGKKIMYSEGYENIEDFSNTLMIAKQKASEYAAP